MAPSDPRNQNRGSSRKALIIVGVLALLGLAYSLARVDILRARLVELEINLQAMQDHNAALRNQMEGLNASGQNSSNQLSQLQTDVNSLNENFGELRSRAEQAQRQSARSEVLYLLRLSNDQLRLGHDIGGALDTLGAAETLLRNSGDGTLDQVHKQIIAALEQLRALPRDDGAIEQQLRSTEQQVNGLKPLGISLQANGAANALPEAGMARAWNLLKQGLASLFTVRKTSAEAGMMLDADTQTLRRRHLQLLLLNARMALHAHDQEGYAAALRDADGWLQQAFDSNDAAVTQLHTQLTQLAQQNIAPLTPDLSPTIQALARYLPGASAATP